MSSEGRPRRTTRLAAKLPVEFTAGSSSTSKAARSADGVKGKGKRAAPENENDERNGTDRLEAREEKNGDTVKKIGRSPGKPKSKSATEKLYDIDFILTNPKSPLVNLDISDVLNYGTWMSLSPESRARLCQLLPSTAFGDHVQEVDEFHPSRRHTTVISSQKSKDPMKIEETSLKTQAKAEPSGELPLDPSFFTDPHFESAARTFQDHLYSGWFTPAHRVLVDRHLIGVRDGSLHAPWKDETWDQEHSGDLLDSETDDGDETYKDPSSRVGVRKKPKRKSTGGESEFAPLVRKGFLKTGDIIALGHKFSALGAIIEKDALIASIHPKTSALTLLASPGTTRDLPPAFLIPHGYSDADPVGVREMVVQTPAQLITALLDLDAQISRADRPRLDTWKILTVWRLSEENIISPEEAALLERGGRESLGTLFYLRGQALCD